MMNDDDIVVGVVVVVYLVVRDRDLMRLQEADIGI